MLCSVRKKKTPHVGGSFSSKYRDIALKIILRVSLTFYTKFIEDIQNLNK